MKFRHVWLVAALAACDDPASEAHDAANPGDRGAVPDAGQDAGPPDAGLRDAAAPDAVTPDAAATPDAATVIPPRPAPRPAGTLSAPRGWRFARGLIHMHSIHSHDACDGNPKPGGVPDATCLARFRAALCHNRFDYVLLTDHPGTFEEISFEDAFLHAEGDRWVRDAQGAPIANYLTCGDGHEVLLMPGSEGDLMPVMLTRKPGPGELRDASAAGSATLRGHGALVFQAHTERFTAEELLALELDGMEIYNLHANMDPRGELGQLPQILPELTAWIRLGAQGPHPDLTYLTVFRENPLALAAWDGITPQRRMLGFAGSDIHENLPPLVRPADGDRIDSYRRLSTWFSNYALVPEVSPEALRQALTEGRLFVTFDLWGAPEGFDFHGKLPDGTVIEQGSEAAFTPGTRLKATPPQAPEGATTTLTLYRVTDAGPVVVHQGPGNFDLEALAPGPYRLDVRITPGHLQAELGQHTDTFLREVVWIYTNPVYLR